MTVTSTSPRGVYRLLLLFLDLFLDLSLDLSLDCLSICLSIGSRFYGRDYAYEAGNESAVTTVGKFSRYSSRPRWVGYSDARVLEVLSRLDVCFVR